jgi:hypothetical protein
MSFLISGIFWAFFVSLLNDLSPKWHNHPQKWQSRFNIHKSDTTSHKVAILQEAQVEQPATKVARTTTHKSGNCFPRHKGGTTTHKSGNHFSTAAKVCLYTESGVHPYIC